MENIGNYHGRKVYKVTEKEYRSLLNDGEVFGSDLYAIVENGYLVSGDTAVGRVNWRTMNVEDFDSRDFVSMRNKPKKKEVKSSYEAPSAPEFAAPESTVGALTDMELDAILDNAMHGSVVGGIDLDDIGTIGDLDVGDNFRPRG